MSIIENEYMTNYQFQKKMMYLHQQISEFEKLDLEHRRTKAMTWLETEEKYSYLLEQTKKNACIIQDAKIRLITPPNFSQRHAMANPRIARNMKIGGKFSING